MKKLALFALVIETTPAILAEKLPKKLIFQQLELAPLKMRWTSLVIDDLFSLNQDFCPKFVKRYENLAEKIKTACAQFSREVKQENFQAKSTWFRLQKIRFYQICSFLKFLNLANYLNLRDFYRKIND